jgi:hypothetical protein
MSTTYSNITSNIEFNNMNWENDISFNKINDINFDNISVTSKFFQDNESLVKTLAENAFLKNNSEEIYKFFPQMQGTLTDLEILFDEAKDESTLEYIRTIPDGKLYYPEPFIASPSFLHEEI